MTTRSWYREDNDNSITAGQKTVAWQSYSQSGNNTPRALREKGIFQDNAYALELTKVKNPKIPIQAYGGLLKWQATPQFLGATPQFEAVPYPDSGQAISRLLEKWRQSSFDLGVSIGEGRESAQMIVERLTSIGRAVTSIRRGDIRGAVRVLGGSGSLGESGRLAQAAVLSKNFSSAFLELELGWKPLIRDIYALADHIKVKPRRNIVRTSLKTRGGVFPSAGFPAAGIYGTNVRRLHLKVEVSHEPSQIERLGLTDPASIFWNLTGLSFIADWFLPIGDTLAMWHALRVMPVMRCCTTEFHERIGFGRVNAGQSYGWAPYECLASSQYSVEHVRMDRYVSNSPFALWGVLAQTPAKVEPKWDPTLRQMGIMSALVHQRILRL